MDAPENLQYHLAAIVEGSDDAIITKNLDSIILSWNSAAERLFGYAREEAIGQPITMIFPEGRMDEEAGFIERLRRGERIAHFETIRKRKDGSLVPISLTVSPVRNTEGDVIGASKIARDITIQHKMAEQQRLLLSEMRHRVGNSFAVAGGLLAVAARQANTVEELTSSMRQRLNTLANVHSKAVSDPLGRTPEASSLSELVSTILEPFSGDALPRMDLPDLPVCAAAVTPLALVFFELATNAVKYGGLSDAGGGLTIRGDCFDGRLILKWHESGVDTPAPADVDHVGFGTWMCQRTVSVSLGGSFQRVFKSGGMIATLDVDLATVTGNQTDKAEREACWG